MEINTPKWDASNTTSVTPKPNTPPIESITKQDIDSELVKVYMKQKRSGVLGGSSIPVIILIIMIILFVGSFFNKGDASDQDIKKAQNAIHEDLNPKPGFWEGIFK